MGQDEIRVEQTMSRVDFSRLRAYYMYRLHPGRIRNLALAFLLLVAIAIVGKQVELPDFVYNIGVCGAVILTFLFIWIDSLARKLERPGKSIGHRVQTLVLSDHGFRVEWVNHGSPLNYLWEAVIHAAETEEHFFLFVNQYAAIILPKRGLKPEKIDRIRELIESRRVLVKQFKKERETA